MKKLRIILSIIFIIIAMAVVSLTLGRDLILQKQPGLNSFAIINFAGYLFFILLPVEALVPYYLAEGHSFLVVSGVAIVTGLLAQFVDYAIGITVSKKTIYTLVSKRKYDKAKKYIDMYGNATIFFFNFFPISSPIVVLAAGMTRHNMNQTMFFSFLGLLGKYTIICLIVLGII